MAPDKDNRVGYEKDFEAYEKYRPGYSEKSVKLVLEEILSPKEASSAPTLKYEILELGSGSGKLTELIVPKIPTGYRYLATDLASDFLDILKSKSLPISTVNGVAASCIPLPDNSVQTVLCGTCLHWFCDDESLKEIHRVLVPGGKMISLTYKEDPVHEPWVDEIFKQRVETCETFNKESLIRKVFWMDWEKEVDESQFFTAVRKERNRGIGIAPGLDSITEYQQTLSYYEGLPEEMRQSLADRLRRDITSYPDVNPDTLELPFIEYFCVYIAQ